MLKRSCARGLADPGLQANAKNPCTLQIAAVLF
jgi:hypothetical protein